jgi:hypothetical protein
MKTVTLRTLVREPLKVKRMTKTGQPVQVTDRGEPLWILQSAGSTVDDEAERRRAIDELFDDVLRERTSGISAALLLEESRR